jgi:hypothetical protein
MTDNLYVMEGWVRVRIDDLHAAAARERLLAAAPARASLARRALTALLGVMRTGGRGATALAMGQPPR